MSNSTTGPLAVPTGTEGHVHYPAGWVSPESAEAANQAAIELELSREQEEAAKAAREQAIADRIAAQHVPAPEAGQDEVKPVQVTTAEAASSPLPVVREPVTE